MAEKITLDIDAVRQSFARIDAEVKAMDADTQKYTATIAQQYKRTNVGFIQTLKTAAETMSDATKKLCGDMDNIIEILRRYSNNVADYSEDDSALRHM